jgi:tRNA dimethylallyltransferase
VSPRIAALNRPKVLMITGPTAVGKTQVAVEVAKRVGGHVISADSMQIYRWMEIGTAQPDFEEMQGVPHYFMSIIRPDEEYSAAQFGVDAADCIRWLLKRGIPPIVAGGARLYLRSLTHGIFAGTPKDPELRRRLVSLAETMGSEYLHKELQKVDPEAAARLDANDTKRVVRALEVYETVGVPMSRLQAQESPVSEFLFIRVALTAGREWIYRSIGDRTKRMFERGFVEEVRRLLEMGYGDAMERIKANGYREAAAFLKGEMTEADALDKMERATRHNAKYQLMWTRNDEGWRLLDVESLEPSLAAERVASIFSGS